MTVAIALVLAYVIVAVVLIAVVPRRSEPDPVETLRKRLADGEITEDEFLAREAALRETAPVRRRRWSR